MKRILLPCDFSTPSKEAFRFAAALARMSKGEVFVLKVTALPVLHDPGFGFPEYGFDAGLLSELEDDAQKHLAMLKAESAVDDVPITLLSETGPVIPTIREIATKKEIDAVVMGTHGEGRWIESVLGTHTEKIVHASPAPVFAIHKFAEPRAIRNIVFPTNLPLDQPVAMKRVKALQAFFDAKLHILFVNSPGDFHTDPDIRTLLGRFVKHYDLANYTFTAYNDYSQDKGILHFTKETGGDMIAMLTHRRIGLGQIFSASITDDVLEGTSWPIWSSILE